MSQVWSTDSDVQIDIHHHHHFADDPVTSAILGILIRIRNKLEDFMVDFTKLQDDVTAQSTIIAGVGTLLSSLSQQIADLKTAGSMDPAAQAAVDALAKSVEDNTAALSAAVAANTPAAPAPTPAP